MAETCSGCIISVFCHRLLSFMVSLPELHACKIFFFFHERIKLLYDILLGLAGVPLPWSVAGSSLSFVFLLCHSDPLSLLTD